MAPRVSMDSSEQSLDTGVHQLVPPERSQLLHAGKHPLPAQAVSVAGAQASFEPITSNPTPLPPPLYLPDQMNALVTFSVCHTLLVANALGATGSVCSQRQHLHPQHERQRTHRLPT